jgi:hypothetical protein
MDSNEALKQLAGQFGREEWFHSTGLDQYGRLVVYVKHMNHATLHDIPDFVDGKQVLVHFAGSLLATRDQFTNRQDTPGSTLKAHVPEEPTVEEEVGSEEEEKSILFLQKELDRLEKICGSNTLQDIFYESHDRENAVTNLSARYPEVRERIEKLYTMYGFDVIYEELDG